jgi:hypothetical protein
MYKKFKVYYSSERNGNYPSLERTNIIMHYFGNEHVTCLPLKKIQTYASLFKPLK